MKEQHELVSRVGSNLKGTKKLRMVFCKKCHLSGMVKRLSDFDKSECKPTLNESKI